MRCIIDPKKPYCVVLLRLFSCFFPYCPCSMKKLVLGLVYLVLSIVYLYFTFRSAVLLEMDDRGLQGQVFVAHIQRTSLDKCGEVGIANLKVLKNAEKKKLGELYIYFSDEQMGDEERLLYVSSLAT